MKRGQTIGGAICLAAAVLLAVLSVRLPRDELSYMVGPVNIPMIILAVLGIALLIAARRRQA